MRKHNGWKLNVSLPVLLTCIREDSNAPYWNQPQYQLNQDLRNPKYRLLLEKVQAQFHIP